MKFFEMFRDREFMGKLWHLTLPISFQSFMLAAVAAADSIMLGRVEQSAMSAVSLATQIQFVQNMLLSAIVGAAAILGAQYWGKGSRRVMEDIFCMILRYAGVVSIAFCAACELAPEFLMTLFTDQQDLITIGASYLRIAGWSYLLTGISQCYLAMMKICDRPKYCAWVSGIAVCMNIGLNAVFIFGLFGLPAMSADGAALATLISRVAELLLSILLTCHKDDIRPTLSGMFRHSKQLTLDFIRQVLPLAASSLLWGVGFTSYTAAMGHMGSDATAANAVAAVVRDLFCCLCNGVGSAAGIMVGNELGKGDLIRGKLYGNRLTILAYVIGVGCMLVIMAITPAVVAFMRLTEGARECLWGLMFIMAFYMIARTVNTVVINGVFAAGGDTLFDTYSLIVCMWGIAVPLAFLGVFVFHWNPYLVYACTCVDEAGKIPWVMFHYRKYKWVRDLTREELS